MHISIARCLAHLGVALTAALALTAGPAPATAAAAVRPGVTCRATPPVVTPSFVPVSCGDGSAFVIHVRWTYLSRTTGRAKGIFMLDDCTPDCASGHYRAYAARLTFTDVGQWDSRPFFTHLRIVFTSRHPPGVRSETATY